MGWEGSWLPPADLTLANMRTAETAAQLRCIGCGATPDSTAADFRCTSCGDLLEFVFPGWKFDPAALKSLWLSRRTTVAAPLAEETAANRLDQSGVWRFREMLPHIPAEHAITMGEGNTPLYHLAALRDARPESRISMPSIRG